MANMRISRCRLISSTRAGMSTTPALLTRPLSAAELPVDGGIHGQHLGLVGHVGLDDQRTPARRTHLVGHALRGRGVAGVVDGHVPAALRGQHGRRGADAAAAAGDQKGLAHVLSIGVNGRQRHGRPATSKAKVSVRSTTGLLSSPLKALIQPAPRRSDSGFVSCAPT